MVPMCRRRCGTWAPVGCSASCQALCNARPSQAVGTAAHRAAPAQHLEHGGALLRQRGRRRVHHMHQQVRLNHLLQRGLARAAQASWLMPES